MISMLITLLMAASTLAVCTDQDSDGFGVCPNCNKSNGCSNDGDDCDDNNNEVYPPFDGVLGVGGTGSITLCPGTYNFGPGDGTIMEPSANNMIISCNNSIIQLVGLAGPGDYGFTTAAKNGITIQHCNFVGFNTGISVAGTGGHHVYNNTVNHTVTGQPIIIVSGDNSIIEENTVFNSTASPCIMMSGGGGPKENNVIANNTMDQCGTTGIRLDTSGPSPYTNITGNIIGTTSQYGIWAPFDNCTISNNVINESTWGSIYIGTSGFSADENIISGNLITSWDNDGAIYIDNGINNKIEYNHVEAPSANQPGIVVMDNSNNVTGNNVTGTYEGHGIIIGDSVDNDPSFNATGCYVTGNNVSNCGTVLSFFGSTYSPRTYSGTKYTSCWNSGEYPDGCITYVSADDYDYIDGDDNDEPENTVDGTMNFTLCLVYNSVDGNNFTVFLREDAFNYDCQDFIDSEGAPSYSLIYEESDVVVTEGASSDYTFNYNASTTLVDGEDAHAITYEEEYYYGVYLSAAINNYIYDNFFSNTYNAYSEFSNEWNISKTAGTNIIGGSWIAGNYWADYSGEDSSGDYIGDTNLPYDSNSHMVVGGDLLPLTYTTTYVDPTPVPEFSDYAIALLLLTVVGGFFVVRRKGN